MILNGFLGKMGRTVIKLLEEDTDCTVVAGIDSRSPWEALPFPAFIDPNDCNIWADVILDFSTADAVPAILEFGRQMKIPLVICTTGLSNECQMEIIKTAAKVAIFQSANMSLGINVMLKLLQNAVSMLKEFDIEIIEKHHSQKIDAPSGTALLLAEAMNKEKNFKYITDRSQSHVKRESNEIGISSIRAGTIAGEHNVLFAASDEVLQITHTALSKNVFAAGAIKAVKFLKGKSPGLYGMEELLRDL